MTEKLPQEVSRRKLVAYRIKPSLAARVAILLVLLCIALVGLDAWQLWRARADQLHDAEVAAANLAKSLSQHAYDTFKEADTVLVGLVERMEYATVDETALNRLHVLLVNRVTELPQLHGLFIYSADGKWIANSQPGKPASLNNSDREYFIYHKMHQERSPHIGSPIRSKSNGEWIVTISRRINGKNGEFAGVILATIRMDYFRRYYEDFDIGAHGAVLVATDTGSILLRRPFDVQYFGKNISNGPLFSKFLPRAPIATNIFTSAIDGITRINSHRRLTAYPLVVLAALSEEDVLASWQNDLMMHGTVMALLVSGLGLLGWRLTRQIKRRASAEAALRNSQAALEAANLSLEQLAMQDGLTGLANRRCFDTVLLREFSRAVREGAAMSLVMIDVDNFKQYNDLYGHAAGDECLRQVSAAVASAVQRPGDLSARYGGEELVVLLPGTNAAGARCVAESIRKRVAALAVAHSGSRAGFVTVSAGVACIAHVTAASKALQLIESADRALYQAKSQGRNQVCVNERDATVADTVLLPTNVM
jgi:diguanylate cyclase (GGDEF)-like protein